MAQALENITKYMKGKRGRWPGRFDHHTLKAYYKFYIDYTQYIICTVTFKREGRVKHKERAVQISDTNLFNFQMMRYKELKTEMCKSNTKKNNLVSHCPNSKCPDSTTKKGCKCEKKLSNHSFIQQMMMLRSKQFIQYINIYIFFATYQTTTTILVDYATTF